MDGNLKPYMIFVYLSLGLMHLRLPASKMHFLIEVVFKKIFCVGCDPSGIDIVSPFILTFSCQGKPDQCRHLDKMIAHWSSHGTD